LSLKCLKLMLESGSLDEHLLVILVLAEAFSRRNRPGVWQDLTELYDVMLPH